MGKEDLYFTSKKSLPWGIKILSAFLSAISADLIKNIVFAELALLISLEHYSYDSTVIAPIQHDTND